jgi:hypothetical protein
MIGPSIVHFGNVNMTSAVMKGDFNGSLRTVCVEPVDSQNNWHQRQFMDTVAYSIYLFKIFAIFFRRAKRRHVPVDKRDADGAAGTNHHFCTSKRLIGTRTCPIPLSLVYYSSLSLLHPSIADNSRHDKILAYLSQ